MSRREGKISERDLHAYVDGALDAASHMAVEAHLAAHPAEAAEVEAWRRQNAALHALYGHAADGPVPTRLSAYRIADDLRAQAGEWRRAAAAAVIALALGAAGGWFARDLLPAPSAPVAPGLIEEAVAAHTIYAGETTHPVEVWADQQDHLQAWLSKRLDRVLVVPDLRSEGLDLIGGRLLPTGGRPAAQFMYEDESGRRVTLYIVPMRDGGETPLRYASLERLEAFFWTDGAIGCALVGELPRDRLKEIAASAYEQLE